MNHLCLCSYCHRFIWHEQPLVSAKWFQDTYPDRYQYLMFVKNFIADRTEEDYKDILDAIQKKDFNRLIAPPHILEQLTEQDKTYNMTLK